MCGLGLGRLRRVGRLRERARGDGDGRAEAALATGSPTRRPGRSACPAAARSTSSWSACERRRVIERLAELARSGGAGTPCSLHRRRGRRRGRQACSSLEGGERLGDGVPEEALGQVDELIRGGRNRLLELGDGSKVFAEWYGAAAAAARLRRGRHGRGALPRGEAARLDGDRRRRAREVRDRASGSRAPTS